MQAEAAAPLWLLAGNLALQFAAFVATVLAFRAAAVVPGLAAWQAGAAGATWLLLGGLASKLAGVALLALVLAGRLRAGAAGSGEPRFAMLLGAVIAAGALWLGHGRGGTLDWMAWLLPVAPLLIDVGFSALRRLRHPAGSPVRVSELVAQAAGRRQAAGIALFGLGLGWYGLVAWWSQAMRPPAVLMGLAASVPVACVWLVISMAAHSAPPLATTAGRAAAGPASRILGFDGLRAFAVALLMFSHAGLVEGTAWERSGAARVFNAERGVQIFFVLSGLLITHLMLAEHARSGRVDLSRFYLRRVLRIFPVYYAAIALSFALGAAAIYRVHPVSFGAAIAYVMNFAPWDYMESTFSHFWSLAVEEHFYFIWPVAVVLARGRARAAGLAAAAAILAMTLWQAFPPAFVADLARSHAVGRWTLPAALPILVGCLAACLLWQRALPPAAARALGIAGLLVFLLPALPAAHALVPEALHSPLSSAAIAAMMAFLIGSPRSLAVKLLELRPLVYLGTISYGIYVWQGIFTGNGSYRSQPGWPPEPLVGAVLAVAVAALSYRYFEEPILRYKDRLGRLAQPQA